MTVLECRDYTLLSEVKSSGSRTLTDGWYILDEGISFQDRLEISGDVRIVLCDGETLTCTDGIHVKRTDRLSIYGQTAGTGFLNATTNAAVNEYAVIGGNSGEDGGEITIHGGKMTADAEKSSSGAAIGGGNSGDGSVFIMYAGSVYAHSWGDGPSGIGGGKYGQASWGIPGICIYGGSVEARGDSCGIGSGGSSTGIGGQIDIYGGTVKATGYVGAGIGSAGGCPNCPIRIHGGEVTATSTGGGKKGCPAIGSGGGVNQAGAIQISGGTVVASSSTGAGIGSGAQGNAGTIEITGGKIWATSTKGGAGIGGGKGGNGGNISIRNAIVIANSCVYDYGWEKIDGMNETLGNIPAQIVGGTALTDLVSIVYSLVYWLSDTDVCGAGIGGGHEANGGNVSIYGGYVLAVSGHEEAAAIGKGRDGSSDGSLYIYKAASVKAGENQNNGQLQSAEERVDACRNNQFAEIQWCDHQDSMYTITADTHFVSCVHCLTEFEEEPHTYGEGDICTACGYLSGSFVFGSPDFTLPEGITLIEANAFEGAAMTVVSIPDSCTSIGDHAFRACTNLRQIRIPAGCALGENVFDACDQVYVFGTAGSPAESYCDDPSHGNCIFVPVE